MKEGRHKVSEISRFFGIIIFMYHNEHNPPHFHAKYGDYEMTVEISSGIIEGKFPKRALSLVMEWFEIHKEELLVDWELLRTTGEFNKIQPLE